MAKLIVDATSQGNSVILSAYSPNEAQEPAGSISFSIVDGPGSISGNVFTPDGVGSTTVLAQAEGAVQDATITINVTPPQPNLSLYGFGFTK